MGRAGRPPGCYNCGCPDRQTITLNCFGCDDRAFTLPGMWQIDMPSEMSYRGDSSGNCSGTYNYPPFGRPKQERMSVSFSYPDLSDLGSSVILEIDVAPIWIPSMGFVQCVWGSNTLRLYEYAYRNGTDQLSFCDIGPSFIRGDDVVQNPWWENRTAAATDVYGVSPNRIRDIITPQNPICGQYPTECTINDPNGVYSCGIGTYGVGATLQIINNQFVAKIYWLPYRDVVWQYLENYGTASVPIWRRRRSYAAVSNNIVPQFLDGSSCASSLYPFSVDVGFNDVVGGSVIEYRKSINCSTDFTGSPVVLTKFSETINQGASQSVAAANGLIGIPSSLTITPL